MVHFTIEASGLITTRTFLLTWSTITAVVAAIALVLSDGNSVMSLRRSMILMIWSTIARFSALAVSSSPRKPALTGRLSGLFSTGAPPPPPVRLEREMAEMEEKKKREGGGRIVKPGGTSPRRVYIHICIHPFDSTITDFVYLRSPLSSVESSPPRDAKRMECAFLW